MILDRCSNDNSQQIINDLTKEDTRCKLFENEVYSEVGVTKVQTY